MFGVTVHETPVGFKYIGALMESEPIVVGGEESGGLSVKGHVPEKDGILACLLMAELVATEKKSLGQILKAIEKENRGISHRPDQRGHSGGQKGRAARKAGQRPGNDRAVQGEKFITTDGYKYLLPKGEWVAFRASGTEAVDPLLHRGQVSRADEETAPGVPGFAQGIESARSGFLHDGGTGGGTRNEHRGLDAGPLLVFFPDFFRDGIHGWFCTKATVQPPNPPPVMRQP